MTLTDLYLEGESALSEAGVDDAPLDARMLLLEAFSIGLNTYLSERGSELPPDEATAEKTALYRGFIKKRAGRMPLQLIVGSTEFMGLEFSVRENVLIPRQDTETLVELVLGDCAEGSGLPEPCRDDSGCSYSLLDLCTGSGCIAVSLAVLGNFSRIAAVDISQEALDAARENAARFNLGSIEFYQGDMFSALPEQTPPFSVITVNPPYIPSGEIENLMPEVRDHEPGQALDGSPDGLEFYRRIAAEAPPYLVTDGRIYMEIGFNQGPDVREIFEAAGFGCVGIFRDLSGNDRVAVARKSQKLMGGKIYV